MHLGIVECHKPFWVTVTLTSDLVFRIIMSPPPPVTLTSDLVFRIIMSPPPPPPPRVPAKAFACICVTIFYTLYGSGLLAQGGGKCSAAQKPRAYAHKMPFLPNKKLMTVMKFSRTSLLNCFVFCASLI